MKTLELTDREIDHLESGLSQMSERSRAGFARWMTDHINDAPETILAKMEKARTVFAELDILKALKCPERN